MKKKIFNLIKKHYLFSTFLLFYAVILSCKLIIYKTPFYDWDESLYIQTGKEMIERKYFLFPVWQSQPWLDKPPLIPFLYGLTAKIFFFAPPEVSTRLFSLTISLIILMFIYALYLKVLKDKYLTTIITVLTAFTPLFLQRAQTINLDIYLLLGWLGYFIFFERFILSFFFLFIAVFSKSLIGFYPSVLLLIYFLFLFLRKKISSSQFKKDTVKIIIQSVILLSWFIAMTFVYKNAFFKQHIIESHFKRVTSSIEFHFGQRTFYIDLIRQQFDIFFWFSIIGFFLSLITFFKKEFKLLNSLYLLPWFIFLNLTKTKIFWYIYPVIPQISFLSLYPLTLFKKNKRLYLIALIVAFILILQLALIKQKVFSTFYSKKEPHYYLAQFAKNRCSNLYILLDKETRKSFATLEKMNLLITTTKWWGNYPSIVYYFGKEVDFSYSEKEFKKKMQSLSKNQCVVITQEDLNNKPQNTKFLKNFNSLYLFQKY